MESHPAHRKRPKRYGSYKNTYDMADSGDPEVTKNRRTLAWSEKKCKIIKDWWMRKRYGITLDIYNKIKADQNDVCAICGKPPTKGKGDIYRLQVDHNHKTGKTRGLLCTGCNLGIGAFEEEFINFQNAIKYLQKHGDLKKIDKLEGNPVDKPSHYTTHPSGIEAIEICGKMSFCIGNAFKYLYRLDKKWNSIEDLKKSRWYINRELFQRGETTTAVTPIYDLEMDWITDFNTRTLTKSEAITTIVGNAPNNVEKAVFYLWLANLKSEDTYYLRHAQHYVDMEIIKRETL